MWFWLIGILVLCARADAAKRPHIVIIIADDLGWNDVGFHGLNSIPTPNIDALAYSGISLHNYYVNPICTPSRAALMTGKYPIHTGMQNGVLYGMSPYGLPLSEKLLPQYLKDLGYKTHLVGKWHLGSYKREYLPLERGFDSHFGFWTGRIDMYDHMSAEKQSWGHDFRRGWEVADELFGKYSTDLFTSESIKIIKNHDARSPLFLMISHSAVHSGNPEDPIRAPHSLVEKFQNIKNQTRRRFAGVLSKLDESVGMVVKELNNKKILNDSIIIFTTDNGGAAFGFNDNAASNYPLRGVKNTLWEGGVRGSAALWSPLLKKRNRVATQRMQIVDWLPTLLRAAGGDPTILNKSDGFDLWEALSEDKKSPRNVTLHNIDDIFRSAAITGGKWKLLKGTNYGGQWDGWYQYEPSDYSTIYRYEIKYVLNNYTGKALKNWMPTNTQIKTLRNAAIVKCNASKTNCHPLEKPCLFDIEKDPCEKNNLAEKYPVVLDSMLKLLDEVNRTAIPPITKPIDHRGDPKCWGRNYINFGDYTNLSDYSQNKKCNAMQCFNKVEL